MPDNKLDNRKVVKNTIVLYVRTIVTLLITLYTSRAILNILGVENYGIYNVVGGFVSMFALVSSTMVTATQRYLNFELGKLKDNHSTEVFSCSVTIHAFLSVVLLILFETIGLWFLNSKMNIEQDRMVAANWLFQFSVITFILQIMRSPFSASIIAHERMKTFAYTSILDAILKLAIVYMLLLPGNYDKLVLYGFLMLLISVFMFLIYVMYARRNFEEIHYKYVRDKEYYKGMLSFAGFNFVSATSVVFSGQGVNILLNIFFGVTTNAARGIATQVQGAVTKFVGDFTMALNPQITKSFAQGNIANMESLIYKGTKVSFILFLIFATPLVVEAPYVLKLWLKTVPDYSIVFVRLSLINALINTLASPISTGVFATGNIKGMSLWIGILRLMIFPASYIAFVFGGDPSYAYSTHIFCDLLLCYIRLYYASKTIGIKKAPYIGNVIIRLIPSAFLSLGIAYLLTKIIEINNIVFFITFFLLSCISTGFMAFFLAFGKSERVAIINIIRRK